jgi:hypothetical protein
MHAEREKSTMIMLNTNLIARPHIDPEDSDGIMIAIHVSSILSFWASRIVILGFSEQRYFDNHTSLCISGQSSWLFDRHEATLT